MSTISAAPAAQNRLGRLLIVGLAAGAAAAVVNLIIFFIGSALGVPFNVVMDPSQPPQALSAVPFMIASLLPALLGAGFYWLLGRFTGRATAIFVGVSAAFALLSLIGPLTMPVPLSTRLVLSLLHLLTAGIIVYGLTRYGRQ